MKLNYCSIGIGSVNFVDIFLLVVCENLLKELIKIELKTGTNGISFLYVP